MTRTALQLSSLTLIAATAAAALLVALPPTTARSEDKPAVAPPHQVIACYFHRTVRCPTCQKISAYIEESVKAGFPDQLKDGSVALRMIDFQDPKNQKFTQAYRITGPTLVLMDVKDGKVVSWKPAPKVWSLVGKKDEFFKYIHGEVQNYLSGGATASR